MRRGRGPADRRGAGIPGLSRAAAVDPARAALVAITAVAALLGGGWPAAAPVAAQPPRVLGDDSLRVVFREEDRALAERVWRTASTPFHLPGLPPGASRIAGTIFLAHDPAAFDSLTRGAPQWSAGVAIPSLRRIIVPAYQSSRTPLGDPLAALRHEIAHLALNAYLPGRIPRWFDEGYATWASGEWDAGAGWRIRLALVRRDAPLLDSLTLDWPRLAPQASLAYLLSASAVHHLATRGSGEQAFTAFLHAWRRQGTMADAMRSVYLTTPGEFEREWRAMVRRRYGWLLALSQAGVFWLVITLLFVLLGTARRRYTRARLEALRVEDRILARPDEHGAGLPYRPETGTDPDPDQRPSGDEPPRGLDEDRPQP